MNSPNAIASPTAAAAERHSAELGECGVASPSLMFSGSGRLVSEGNKS